MCPWRAGQALMDLCLHLSATWIMQQILLLALLCLKAASKSVHQQVTAVKVADTDGCHDVRLHEFKDEIL